jgi:hypothetical protein
LNAWFGVKVLMCVKMMQIAKLAAMVTTRPINHQYTCISWSVLLCFDLSITLSKSLECIHHSLWVVIV